MKKFIFILLTFLTTVSLYAESKAVVFDFGGVMTGEPDRDAVVQFIRESFHFSKEDYERINQKKRLANKQGKRDIEFWLSYAESEGIALPCDWEESFKYVLKESIGVNETMYLLVQELKGRGIVVGMLSNIDERLAKLLDEFHLYDPFSPCLLSYKIGIEKPDPKAYELLLKELHLSGAEVIFIDDRKENIEAAKTFGIEAILFESEPQLRTELTKRGLLNDPVRQSSHQSL